MKYFGLFIGENFDPFTMTVRAKSIGDAVAQFERAYGFSHGGNMNLEVYNKDKEKIKTIFPFKIQGYTCVCPYGQYPHFCNCNYDEEDEDNWYWDQYNYYPKELRKKIRLKAAIILRTKDSCPYLIRSNWIDRCWTEPNSIPMKAECKLPFETKYKFFASEAAAKRWANKFFGIVTNLEKI